MRTRVQRKLAKLYGGNIVLPESQDCFINLSDYELNDDEKELLNLGLNCHYLPKQSRQRKKAELELLYQQICQLARAGKVEVTPLQTYKNSCSRKAPNYEALEVPISSLPDFGEPLRVSGKIQILLSDELTRLPCSSF